MIKQVKLKDVATHSKGKQINGDDLIENGTYDYLNGGINPSGKWNEYNTESDTVTISEGGNSSGYVNFMMNPFWCGAHCYYLYNLKIQPKYLYYALKSQEKRLMSLRTGAAMPNIKKSALSEFTFQIDDNSINRNQIVTILDIVSNIILNKNQQLSEYDQLIKSRFVEMFENKYEKIKVSTKLRTTSGGTPKSDNSEFYSDGTIPWLTSGEVNQGRIEKTEKYITEKGLANSSAKWIPKKSIVIAMYGATAGKVGIIEIPTTTNQAVCAVLPHDEYNPEYLRFAFEYISDELAGKAVGGGQPNISQTIIKDSLIFNPPLEVQREFSTFVKQIDKLKFEVQKSLNETKVLFDSLMQKYFG